MYRNDIAFWDIDNLQDTYGEAYCIGADICILFGTTPQVEKRVKTISPQVKVHKYSNLINLQKVIEL